VLKIIKVVHLDMPMCKVGLFLERVGSVLTGWHYLCNQWLIWIIAGIESWFAV